MKVFPSFMLHDDDTKTPKHDRVEVLNVTVLFNYFNLSINNFGINA